MKNRWKLTKLQIEELQFLYVHKGWNNEHLSKKYNISHQGAGYRTASLIRVVPELITPPEEIRHLYKGRVRAKRYKNYLDEALRNRKPCEHLKWIKVCSCCNHVFQSESSFAIPHQLTGV